MLTARKSPSSALGDELHESNSASPDPVIDPSQDYTLSKARFFGLSDSALNTLRLIKGWTSHGTKRCASTYDQIHEELKIEISTAKKAVSKLKKEGLITFWQKGHELMFQYNLEQVIAYGNDTSRLDKWLVSAKPKAKSIVASKLVAPEPNVLSAVTATASAFTAYYTEHPCSVAAPENSSDHVLSLEQPSAASALELAFTATTTPFALLSVPEPTPFTVGAVLSPLELSSESTLELVPSAETTSVAAVSVAAVSLTPVCDTVPQSTEPVSVPVSQAVQQSAAPEPATETVSVETASQPVPVSNASTEVKPILPDNAVTTNDTILQGTETVSDSVSDPVFEPTSEPVNTAVQPSAVPVPAATSVTVEPAAPSAPVAAPVSNAPCANRSSKEVSPLFKEYMRCANNGSSWQSMNMSSTIREIISLSPDSFSDAELAQYGFKRSDFAPPTQDCYLPTPEPKLLAAEQEPTSVSGPSAPHMASATVAAQPPAQQPSLDSMPDLSEEVWPEHRHDTVVANADAPYIEVSMEELLAQAQANDHTGHSSAAAVAAGGVNSESQPPLHSPETDLQADSLATALLEAMQRGNDEPFEISPSEFARLPATDPRMEQHNQQALRLFSAPNSALLPIHSDLYHFDFTQSLKKLRLENVVFWGDSEPQLRFDFTPVADFLSVNHVSAQINHYSWPRIFGGFEQFFRFSVLSELCYYSSQDDIFTSADEAPKVNKEQLKEFFATHQRGFLMQLLAVAHGTTDGPYRNAANIQVQWCSDSLWASISHNMRLYKERSPMAYLTSCIRRQLISVLNDKDSYYSMLQFFTHEFLHYARFQPWVKHFRYYGFGSEYLRFVYPTDFLQLMHVTQQRTVFRLTYPMLLWRKIACVRAASGLEDDNNHENSSTAAQLLFELATQQQAQNYWDQFVAAFGDHYPFLHKVGGCEHV